MRVAVIGAFGQLGSDLMPLLGERATALGHGNVGRETMEVSDPASVARALDKYWPTHVINCAAYNLVDPAEGDPQSSFRVNAIGPRHLAEWCAASGAILMHISTDYVFGADVSRRVPFDENAPTGPVSVYGRSKLEGEEAVRSVCPRHFIVRTCGLYGHRAARGKGNFVETMLQRGYERPELRIVADQRCTPTSTADLARALVSLIETDAFGLYHATNAGDCSWFEFAGEIFRLANCPVQAIPVTAAEYGAQARRPDYSVLDCSKLTDVLGRPMPSWQEALARYIAQRGA